MSFHEVNVVALPNCVKLPEYATRGAVAMDAYAAIEEPIIVKPGESKVIPLGFSVEVPDGFYLAVLSRSGLACKGVQIGNCPGVVDPDYRGQVGAVVYNARLPEKQLSLLFGDFSQTDNDFTVEPGDRICQIALKPISKIRWKQVHQLEETERGAGGFGSTGI